MLHDKSLLVLLNEHVKFEVQYFFLSWQRVSDVEEILHDILSHLLQLCTVNIHESTTNIVLYADPTARIINLTLRFLAILQVCTLFKFIIPLCSLQNKSIKSHQHNYIVCIIYLCNLFQTQRVIFRQKY